MFGEPGQTRKLATPNRVQPSLGSGATSYIKVPPNLQLQSLQLGPRAFPAGHHLEDLELKRKKRPASKQKFTMSRKWSFKGNQELFGHGTKLKAGGYAGLGPCFHFPCHFGTGFLSHGHFFHYAQAKTFGPTQPHGSGPNQWSVGGQGQRE